MEKLYPVLKDYIWGGEKLKSMFARNSQGVVAESWEVSVHPDGESKTRGGTLAALLRQNPSLLGEGNAALPVLIKYIDAQRNLSVQVHPDDAFARREENDNGKTEMWYIISADAGAGIYCGFKKDVTSALFEQKVQEGKVEELLNFIPVQAGDCYLIEAGTVHAICAGCVILEVQQSSNVTYRVYDYNRVGADGKPRALHLQKALKVINFSAFSNHTNAGGYQSVAGGKERLLTSCKYFTCRELILNGEYRAQNSSSFTAVNVVEGEGVINGEKFTAGDSFFVACGEEIIINGRAKAVLTTAGERREKE